MSVTFYLLSLGDFISFLFQSLYLYDYLDSRGFISWSLIITAVFIVLFLLLGLIYLIVQTLRMKKNITAMGTLLNDQGEVTRIFDDFGKKGWMNIYGENWRFRSQKPLKVGDLVKVIEYKKMDLIVEKVHEDF